MRKRAEQCSNARRGVHRTPEAALAAGTSPALPRYTCRPMSESTPNTPQGPGPRDPGNPRKGPGDRPQPAFDPEAPNQARPRLRPVRGFAAKHGEQVLLGLADARQISDRVVFTAPAVQAILPHMTGEHDLNTIVTRVGGGLTRQMLEHLVAQLDEAGLIEGPKFDAMLDRLRREFDASTHLPPASTAQFADALVMRDVGQEASEEQKSSLGPEKLRRQFDSWIAEALKDAPDPSFDELPKAIIAPHLDYGRGWLNYAMVYGRLRVVDKPDRVVILGTNHFGTASGVCGCDKGFETPLGRSDVDAGLLASLRENLGNEDAERLFEHRYDHEREHSIELQVGWIQHVFGPRDDGGHVPVFAALVHDPARNNGDSYDGDGLAFQPFVDAMRKTLAALPGKTLIVSSADLSHVGPQFGDQKPLAGDEQEVVAARNSVLQHDREMLELFASGKPEEMVASMAWQQNPTRWCSVGNMVAVYRIVEPESVRMLHYMAAMDQQGMGMVSSCAAALF